MSFRNSTKIWVALTIELNHSGEAYITKRITYFYVRIYIIICLGIRITRKQGYTIRTSYYKNYQKSKKIPYHLFKN